jgi:hypothetical protein
MHRRAAHAWAAGLALSLLAGCALPKVALGASVSLRRAAGQDSSAHRVRSALWLAMIYVPGASEPEPEPEPEPLDDRPDIVEAGDDLQPSATPCAFELSCAFEREAIDTEREREISP